MPRKPLIEKRAHLHITLEPRLRTQLDLFLWSDLEQRVPQGAHQGWVSDRIKEFFSWRTLDLAPYGFPPGFFVRGPEEMLNQLKQRMEDEQEG
jgi:hypothetical protein